MESDATRAAWAALDAYFRDTPYFVSAHHLESFDRFAAEGIAEKIRSMNPIVMAAPRDDATGKQHTVDVNLGERVVSLDRPTIVDPDGTSRPLFPNEARLRDLTYGANVYADVSIQYYENGEKLGEPVTFDAPQHVGFVPVMLHSKLCLLRDMPPAALREMGECPHDRGGYFVIDGKEKVVVTQEAPVLNRLYVLHAEASRKDVALKAFMRCSTLDAKDVFPRTVTVRVRARDATTRANTIGVVVPHIGERGVTEVPLFVLFRALGVESDRGIMEHVVHDPDAPEDADVVEFLRASAAEAAKRGVFDQRAAVHFLTPMSRFGTQDTVKEVLVTDLFPNVGTAFAQKAVVLGQMVRRVVRVAVRRDQVDDLDD